MSAPYGGPLSSDLRPDTDAAWRWLSWWFHACTHGLIEIGWLLPSTGQLTAFRRFELEDESILAAMEEINSIPGQSLYVRASTIALDAPRGKTTDRYVVQAPGVWADLDTPDQVSHAQQVESMIRANGWVTTGKVPSPRFQLYFRASEPLTSPETIRQFNRRLQRLYGGDPAVVNPSRLMRMPGTIAWPTKPGRVPELTAFDEAPSGRPSVYPISTLASQLPALEEPYTAPEPEAAVTPAPAPTASLGALDTSATLIAAIRAGQQWHNNMIRLVAHWVARDWSTTEILCASEALTLPGYTHDQTRAEVRKAISGAREKWNRPEPPQHSVDSAPPAGLAVRYFHELTPNLNAADFVEDLLIEGGMSVVYGESNSGKTFFAADLALHVAQGISWCDRQTELGGVIYCALEGSHGISNRLAAYRIHEGIEDFLPFGVVSTSINLLDPKAHTEALIALIKAEISHMSVPIRLVVVDTLSRALAGGNENAPDDMGSLVINTDRIRQATNAHVMFVHHSGKDTAKGARGHSLLRAATDTEIEVADDNGFRTARVTKQRELECVGEFSFTLKSVSLGTNRRGKDVSSCVVVFGEQETTSQRSPKLTGHTLRALQILSNLLASDGRSGFQGCPDGVASVPEEWWRERFYSDAMPGAPQDTKKRAFRRAADALVEYRKVAMASGRVWVPYNQ